MLLGLVLILLCVLLLVAPEIVDLWGQHQDKEVKKLITTTTIKTTWSTTSKAEGGSAETTESTSSATDETTTGSTPDIHRNGTTTWAPISTTEN